MRKLACIIGLLALSMVMPVRSWATDTPDAPCVLKVGWEEWYPFLYRVEGKFAGSEYDLLQRLATTAECKLVFVEASWDNSLKMLADGKLDMLYGASHTAEREAYANFSKDYRIEQIVLVVPVNQLELQPGQVSVSLKQWLDEPNASGQPRKLGLVKAYFYGDELEKLIRAPARQSQLMQLQFDQQLHRKLIKGLIDGYLVEAGVVQNQRGEAVKWVSLREYKTEPLHLMFSKQVPQAVVDRFNKAMERH